MTSNNWTRYKERPQAVVNYFQNLYLCDLKQPYFGIAVFGVSCELLSKFVSLWLPTTIERREKVAERLWITFKICIFVISNNSSVMLRALASVVNYFQNLYLCDLKQQCKHLTKLSIGCELLSKFVPLWFPTTIVINTFCQLMLWITFKICIFVIFNNIWKAPICSPIVVNYFQNLYLFDFQQRFKKMEYSRSRCELLSKFVSLWFPTTSCQGVLSGY